jgi:PAT family beta-lactamase induction signal transducer AmpG
MTESNLNWRAIFKSRSLLLMPLFGFASGLPLALTAGTLQAWLTVWGTDLKSIGLFALVGLPYTVKFVWSPILDRYALPFLGRRRAWMLLAQIGLLLAIAAMPILAQYNLLALTLGALLVAFLSATQDIAFDAYRAEILLAPERGTGAALSVTGYRLGMLTSGAAALVLSEYAGWPVTYFCMAAAMSIGIFATLLAIEPVLDLPPPASLRQAMLEPFREFLTRTHARELLGLIILYKLGDALAGALNVAFLIRVLGFTAGEVGVINKGVGLVSLLVGAFIGGGMLQRWGMLRALVICGILQALTNLGFALLALNGKSYLTMASVVSLENLAGGMGTSVFVALLMGLCNHRYTATQFALLSAASALGRVLCSPFAGYVVEAVGWASFFVITTLAALPGLGLLYVLRDELSALSTAQDQGHD